MLYSEFTSMEMTLGRAIDTSSGNTGFVFIKVSFMGAKASFPEISAQEKPHNGGLERAIVWRKVANIYAVKIHTGFIEVPRNTVHRKSGVTGRRRTAPGCGPERAVREEPF